MKMRPLGQSGIQTSVVGFGAWAVGGWTWGGAEESDSIRAIHAFLEAGGNLVDTAPIYGFGHSEEVVGKAIADRRDKVILATKCAMRWDLNDAQRARAHKKFTTTKNNVDWDGRPATTRSRSTSTPAVMVFARKSNAACSDCKPITSTSTKPTGRMTTCPSRKRWAP